MQRVLISLFVVRLSGRAAKPLLRSDDIVISGFKPGRQILVEEVLSGQEYQLDGFVHDNKVQFCALGVKTAVDGGYGFREVQGMLYRPPGLKDSRAHDFRPMKWCEHVLEALQFKNGTFHIEVKVNGPDIRLLEVNPRPGGGANVPAIRLLSGVDLNSECLRLWMNLPRSSTPNAATFLDLLRCPLPIDPWKGGLHSQKRNAKAVADKPGHKTGMVSARAKK